MLQFHQNYLNDIEIFGVVVEAGNFSEAARRMEMDPSSISKIISRLELRLNTRLFRRTTRRLGLTAEGKLFYSRVQRILTEIQEAERCFSSQQPPAGNVRITCSVPFALHQIIPLLPALYDANPKINITLLTTDQVVDLIEQRCDFAIRIGKLKDSTYKARKLAESKMLIVASPHYLKKFGHPKRIAELKQHNTLNFYGHPELNEWPLKDKTKLIWHAKNIFSVDNGECMLKMVLAGGGIARLSAYMVRDYLNKGELISLLEKYNSNEWQSIYLVHAGGITPRVKYVMDFFIKQLGQQQFV